MLMRFFSADCKQISLDPRTWLRNKKIKKPLLSHSRKLGAGRKSKYVFAWLTLSQGRLDVVIVEYPHA